jgi:hypothetical protein
MFSTLAVTLIATALFEVFLYGFITLFRVDSELYPMFAVNCLRIYPSARPVIPLVMLRDVILLIAFSLVLPVYLGVTGIFWAAPAVDLGAMAISALALVRVWNQFAGIAAAPESEDVVLKPARPGLIITIDREQGSGGKIIGKLVAEELQIPFYS